MNQLISNVISEYIPEFVILLRQSQLETIPYVH